MIDRFKSVFERRQKRAFDTSIQSSDSISGRPASPNARLAEPLPSGKGISFFVDDVEPSQKPLCLTTLGESLELRSGATVIIMPEKGVPALADFAVSSLRVPAPSPREWADHHHFLHPLIEAVHRAFNDHRPLVLSPDAIWLTIVQGFAHHLIANSEAFRGRIVAHHGKKELCVQSLSLEPVVWPQLVAQLSSQIRDNSDPFLYETLACEFATTSPTIKTAFEIALMETFSRYFEYTVVFLCGIPKITLEGTAEDWQRIRDRAQVLATFDLDWWTNKLTPILDQFIDSAKGSPDLAFWKAIYQPKEVYGGKLVRGWISDLFPYLGAEKLCRNQELDSERVNWIHPETEANKFPGVSLKWFPSGISRAPVTVEAPGHWKAPVELLGGFFGVSQSPNDGALAPMISWAVVSKDTRISPTAPNFDDVESI